MLLGRRVLGILALAVLLCSSQPDVGAGTTAVGSASQSSWFFFYREMRRRRVNVSPRAEQRAVSGVKATRNKGGAPAGQGLSGAQPSQPGSVHLD